MISVALYSRALSIGLAAALLVGCGGSQIGSLASTPEGIVRTRIHDMHRETGQDLVYATGGCGGVCVLSYPDGKLKGSISLTYPVGGDCSDSAGNVFVTNNGQVLEYAHGGTTPIATLSLPGLNAGACGVDPKTGNLAVTCCGGGIGNVAIFPNATGAPTLYQASNGASYLGYDTDGNLFVSGYTSDQNALAELPYGTSSFIPIAINGKPGGPGQVQWDGRFITIENQRNDITIARLRVSGSTASVVGKTRLKSPKWATQSWIVGNRVVTPYSSRGGVTNKIGIWRYPQSGKVLVKFGDFGQTHSTRILGVTVSRS